MISASPISLSKNRKDSNPFSNPKQKKKPIRQSEQQKRNSSLRQTKQYFSKYCSNKESQIIGDKLNVFTPINQYKYPKVVNFSLLKNTNPQVNKQQSIKIIQNTPRKDQKQEDSQFLNTSKIIPHQDDNEIIQIKIGNLDHTQEQFEHKSHSRKVSRKNKTAGKIHEVGYRKSIKISQNFRSQKRNNFISSYQSSQIYQKTQQRETSLSPPNSSGSQQKNIHSRHNMQQMNIKLRQIRNIQQYAAKYRIMTERPDYDKVPIKVLTQQNNPNKTKPVLNIRGQRNKTIGYNQHAKHDREILQRIQAEKLKKTMDLLYSNKTKQLEKPSIPINAFRSTFKKKSVQDNPSFLASVIKKKMEILPRHELYEYINSLTNKSKNSSPNNQALKK